MKKYIYLLLSAFLFIPFIVNAETITYNVCESGCEYTNLGDVVRAIYSISDLTDKDIVINVNSDMNSYLDIGSIDNMANSVTINGNNHDFNNSQFELSAKNIIINDCINIEGIIAYNSDKVSVNNSSINFMLYMSLESNMQIRPKEINLSDVLEMDEKSMNDLKSLGLMGNIKIDNMDFSSVLIVPIEGTIKIYNSEVNKIVNGLSEGEKFTATTNIYNSKFNSLKYVNITSKDNPVISEYATFMNNSTIDASLLNYDIYDVNLEEGNYSFHLNTYIYFDKEAKLKPGDKLNLVDYLDYYTEDKEIEYTIEDESIAKIENKELIALKEGSTKVTVTTDEGHVVYNINFVVEKETIPEKIDKMTIKVPITGSKIKAWVVVVSAILLGVIGVCSYMLIKRKK